MSASTADLDTKETRTLDALLLPVAASTNVWKNENVGFNVSGYIVPMASSAVIVFQGYAELQALNSGGSNGDLSVPVNLINSGPDGRLYVFDCSSATQGWCGTLGYFTDDHTVAQSASNSNIAGMIVQFLSATKVLVDVSRRSVA